MANASTSAIRENSFFIDSPPNTLFYRTKEKTPNRRETFATSLGVARFTGDSPCPACSF
jgi:hypothetical protein